MSEVTGDIEGDIEGDIRALAAGAPTRQELWVSFLGLVGASSVAELGVYRGDFAARLLDECPSIEHYYMIDPWKHLDDWNKPANKSNDAFEGFYQEVLAKTAAHEHKRIVLRGRTADVIGEIEDGSLDFAYVDGDHTLRGITMDLIQVYPKIREGQWLGGDDFCRSIFQHSRQFEPTLVFPFAVYFAEAVGARIYALPRKQFLMQKVAGSQFEFVDLTGRYGALTLKEQLDIAPSPPAKGSRRSPGSRPRRGGASGADEADDVGGPDVSPSADEPTSDPPTSASAAPTSRWARITGHGQGRVS